jgi:hypothetical protein
MLITIGILVVLGVFAGARRGSTGMGEVAGVTAVSSLGDPVAGAGRAVPASAGAYLNPLDPPPKAEWEVLTGCELIRTPINAAHHFRVRRDGKPMVFRLYFVESPKPAEPAEDEVEGQAEYFGWPSKWSPEEYADRSMELGQQAWQEVEGLLASRPFMVLTKYEVRRETHHFYALVVIEDEQGRRRTLQEWLVERGFATLTRPTLGWLPIQVSSEGYVERLEGLERTAQRERRGGWGLVTAAP